MSLRFCAKSFSAILCLCAALFLMGSLRVSAQEYTVADPYVSEGYDSGEGEVSSSEMYESSPDFPSYESDPATYEDEPLEPMPIYEYDGTQEQQPPPPAEPEVVPRPDIELKDKTVLIGRIPYLSLKEMMNQAKVLLLSLKRDMGVKEVRLVTSQSYAGVLEALSRGTIDVAWIGPMAYVMHREKGNLMPLAKAKHLAEPSYRGIFLTRRDGDVQGLDDIKGKIIGFVDPESASGYLYPLYLLKRLKIDPHKACAKVVFLKRHDAVIQALLEKKIDVGVCLEATVASLRDPKLRRQLLVLGRTDVIPSDVIVTRKDCPVNLRECFLQALLKVAPPATKTVSTTGTFALPTFLPAADEEFDQVHAILRTLKR